MATLQRELHRRNLTSSTEPPIYIPFVAPRSTSAAQSLQAMQPMSRSQWGGLPDFPQCFGVPFQVSPTTVGPETADLRRSRLRLAAEEAEAGTRWSEQGALAGVVAPGQQRPEVAEGPIGFA